MKAERWQQINDLFQSATERAPEERAAFLDEACHGDEGLCREVESLIASYERAGTFIESPAFEAAPEFLTNEDRSGALVGESIGHYRIESLIGVGGMGEVYLARDDLLGRKVALKFLPQSLTADEAELNRLEHEARTASALNHPNILTVHEIGVDGRRHFIATEFIEGETLRAVLARGKLDLRDALNIATQVGSALAAAHKSGVLHRDIKPENIMLRPDAYVKVLDFGIAKLSEQKEAPSKAETRINAGFQTASGLIFGTAHYMSPEQARGQTVDARTDIWSFGVVLFEMLAGRPPFEGKTPSECIAAVLKREPPLVALKARQVPARLEQIIRKALRKDKEERYQSVEEMVADLRQVKEVNESITSGWKRRKKIAAFLAAIVAVALAIAGLFIYPRPTRTVTNTLTENASALALVIPEKSIAVLPFSNLSKEEENAFFADGVQDEILTNLARVGDLKVISRASVMQYKSGVARNLRKIGQQLGVAHLLEGSVQRAANRVRVNAKLIDARTDAHLWAQTYDRDLADVFTIQSEIAKAIADQLQARLSPNEKAAIEKAPTADLAAFDLYTRAKTLLLTTSFIPTGEQNLRQAVEFLNQAAARDPAFFEAYCQLAFAHGRLYSLGLDHTGSRLASAEAALQAAIRLRPDAGETHLARANYLYYGPRDYAGALAELENARRSLPNDPRLSELTGYILRRRGQQEEGLRYLEKALELDPRNYFIMQQIALSFQFLRRYPEEAAILDRALTIVPKDAATKVNRALVDFYWKADTKPLHQAIDSILAGDPGAISQVADSWFVCALAEHDRVAAERALVALGDSPWWVDAAVILRRSFGEGLLPRVMKDEAKAWAAFSKARAEQEKIVQAQPDYGPALCVLGLIDAALGRKEAALEEGRRAIELLPVEKDSINGTRMLVYFAIIAAWTGEKDLALQQLELGARAPTPSQALNYGALKLLPFWDPLRGDPRFEDLVRTISPSHQRRYSGAPITEKSIAVLPFADLSPARDQEYFCDGIQEEILTRLAKVADLKVISRTSTQQFQSKVGNLSEIAKQLGVAHILEGSVQKAADQVRVNVQLINAQTDSHLWAETYDRKLTDIFGVESEIAKRITESLHAKLTGREEQALAVTPTNDPEAYDAYLRGLAFEARSRHAVLIRDLARKAIGFYERAVQLDPKFAIAWARLSRADAFLYFNRDDATLSARGQAAKRALENAQKLEPDSPETLLALGYYQYLVLYDYGLAKATFSRVIKTLPGNSEVPTALGRVTRREGHWDQSIAYFEQALALDPCNVELLSDTAWTYLLRRQFSAALKLYDRALDITPNDSDVLAVKASIYQAQGNLQEAARFLSGINEQTPSEGSLRIKITQLRLERNYAEAVRLLQARLAQFHFASQYDKSCDQVALAFAQRVAGDTAGAKVTAEQARNTLERLYRDQPDNALIAAYLSQAYAAIWEKDSALKAAERAIVLLPRANDAVQGPALEENLALIQTTFGENSRAISTLSQLLQVPGDSLVYGPNGPAPITLSLLRLDPIWDPLRADPRFERLVAKVLGVADNKSPRQK